MLRPTTSSSRTTGNAASNGGLHIATLAVFACCAKLDGGLAHAQHVRPVGAGLGHERIGTSNDRAGRGLAFRSERPEVVVVNGEKGTEVAGMGNRSTNVEKVPDGFTARFGVRSEDEDRPGSEEG